MSDVSDEDATRILARMSRRCYAEDGPVEFKLLVEKIANTERDYGLLFTRCVRRLSVILQPQMARSCRRINQVAVAVTAA